MIGTEALSFTLSDALITFVLFKYVSDDVSGRNTTGHTDDQNLRINLDIYTHTYRVSYSSNGSS